MEHFAVFDPYVALGLGLLGALTICMAILFFMRDTTWVSPTTVSESVYCSTHRRRVVVDFVDRVDTGLRFRSVEHCPLRAADERCNEDCCIVRHVPGTASGLTVERTAS
ncbi:MAG TPA: hypothetical protein VL403_04895 [Candidatus Kryptonia bacterium]|nr:hypothetical protein [Candidatus Kryptonia bacterium]